MRDAAVVEEVWESLPPGVEFVKHYSHGVDLVACGHDERHRYTKVGGAVACRVCMGDEFTTSDFVKPVKRLVKLAKAKKQKKEKPMLVLPESLF